MTTFDAPSREACQVRRERTNTPLQALMLMNEPQFVEAAAGWPSRRFAKGGSTTDDRLTYMYRVVLARPPDARDLSELGATLKDLTAHFAGHPDAAKQLIGTGQGPPSGQGDAPTDRAAWTLIANVILNLDEAISKG